MMELMIVHREMAGLDSMFNLFLLESKEKGSPWVHCFYATVGTLSLEFLSVWGRKNHW